MNKNQRGRRRKYGETGFENWGGYMPAKISKLQEQFQNEKGNTEKKGIFSDIAIFVNGYTEPSGEELKRIMLTHGGTYHHYYSRTKTTHIIASNLPNVKIQSLKTDFIVSPKWISESVAAGKLLDYKKYLLYLPNQSTKQSTLNFEKYEENKKENITSFNSREISKKLIADDDVSSSPTFDDCSLQEELSAVSKELKDDTILEESTNASPNVASKKCLSTANPNFLSEFYNNSRLHHISTSGAMFKEYVKELQNKEDIFPGRDFLKNWMEEKGLSDVQNSLSEMNLEVIMHIDMDCFFVSVGLIKHPELKGLPVAVTHATRNSIPKRDKDNFEKELQHFKRKFKATYENKDKEQDRQDDNDDSSELEANAKKQSVVIDEKCSMAEIASCSYEARKRGVKNGMFLGVSLKLCPELKTIPYDFEGYKAVSLDLYNIVSSYTKNIEAVSCDEMYADLGDVVKECRASPLEIATCMRHQIQAKTKCPCSVGIGPNMITARMATKKAKPNGQFMLESSKVQDFMKEIPVSDLPGVGWSLRKRLEGEGVKTCADLQRISQFHLQETFGQKTGKSLYELSRGIDNRPVNKDHQRRSVSAEVNYGIRFENFNDADKFLLELSEEVCSRMNKIGVKGRTITLKLKVRAKDAPVETAKFMGHGVCNNVAKSSTLAEPTGDKRLIYRECKSLLKQVSATPKDLRGVGIQVSKLENSCGSSVLSISNYLNSKTQKETSKRREEKPSSNVVSNTPVKKEETTVRTSPKKSLDLWLETGSSNSHSVKECSGRQKDILDVEVLNALPPELRDQVIEEYKSQGYVIPDFKVDSNVDSSGNDVVSNFDTGISKGLEIVTLSGDSDNSASNPATDYVAHKKISNLQPPTVNPQPGTSKQFNATDPHSGFSNQLNCDNPHPSTSKTLLSLSPQPGPSREFIFDPGILPDEPSSDCEILKFNKTPNEGGERDSVKDYTNLSFSQIDSSFLNALPFDVRVDLKRDLQKHKRESIKSPESPVKQGSNPVKGVKKKRGRPKGSGRKGGNPKVLNPKMAALVLSPSKSVSSGAVPQIKNITRGEVPLVDLEPNVKMTKRMEDAPAGNGQKPNLCGEYETESIKNLISEWVKTCDRPANLDINILTKFFSSLIREKDLEKLELLLKFLRRRAERASAEWKKGFTIILKTVQSCMVENYNAPLLFLPPTTFEEQ